MTLRRYRTQEVAGASRVTPVVVASEPKASSSRGATRRSLSSALFSLDSSVLDAKIDCGAGCARDEAEGLLAAPGKSLQTGRCESFPVVRAFCGRPAVRLCRDLRRQAGFAGVSTHGKCAVGPRSRLWGQRKSAGLQVFMERRGFEPLASGLQSSSRTPELSRKGRGFAARAGFSSVGLRESPGAVGAFRRRRAGYVRDEVLV
jgi:hypothetical protein